jgi:hypothetical protein
MFRYHLIDRSTHDTNLEHGKEWRNDTIAKFQWKTHAVDVCLAIRRPTFVMDSLDGSVVAHNYQIAKEV